jgi:hypothetical protein
MSIRCQFLTLEPANELTPLKLIQSHTHPNVSTSANLPSQDRTGKNRQFLFVLIHVVQELAQRIYVARALG